MKIYLKIFACMMLLNCKPSSLDRSQTELISVNLESNSKSRLFLVQDGGDLFFAFVCDRDSQINYQRLTDLASQEQITFLRSRCVELGTDESLRVSESVDHVIASQEIRFQCVRDTMDLEYKRIKKLVSFLDNRLGDIEGRIDNLAQRKKEIDDEVLARRKALAQECSDPELASFQVLFEDKRITRQRIIFSAFWEGETVDTGVKDLCDFEQDKILLELLSLKQEVIESMRRQAEMEGSDSQSSSYVARFKKAKLRMRSVAKEKSRVEECLMVWRDQNNARRLRNLLTSQNHYYTGSIRGSRGRKNIKASTLLRTEPQAFLPWAPQSACPRILGNTFHAMNRRMGDPRLAHTVSKYCIPKKPFDGKPIHRVRSGRYLSLWASWQDFIGYVCQKVDCEMERVK